MQCRKAGHGVLLAKIIEKYARKTDEAAGTLIYICYICGYEHPTATSPLLDFGLHDGRNARYKGVIRHLFRDNASCSNDAAAPDTHTWHDENIRPEPAIVADLDGKRFSRPLLRRAKSNGCVAV